MFNVSPARYLRAATFLIPLFLLLVPSARADEIDINGSMTTVATFEDTLYFDIPSGLQSLTVRIPMPADDHVFGFNQSAGTVDLSSSRIPNNASTQTDSYGNSYHVETFKNPQPGRCTYSLNIRGAVETVDLSQPMPRNMIADIEPQTDVAQYLQPTPLVQSRDPQIVTLAHTFLRQSQVESDVAASIQHWIQHSITYDESYADADDDAETVIHRHVAACDGWAQLFLALARADNIPARFVAGFSYGGHIVYPKDKDSFNRITVTCSNESHAWVEVWYPNIGWIPYEPQISTGFVDSHRLKVWVGKDSESAENFLSWTTLSSKQYDVEPTEIQKPSILTDTINVNCDTVYSDATSINSVSRSETVTN